MNSVIFNAQTNLIASLRLFFQGEETRLLSEHAQIAAICGLHAALLHELYLLNNVEEVYTYRELYEFRDTAVKGIMESYAALCNVITQDRLQSLQFNGVEIDTELIRIFLFGQNLVAMPNP